MSLSENPAYSADIMNTPYTLTFASSSTLTDTLMQGMYICALPAIKEDLR